MRRGWGSKNYRENVLAAIVTVYLYSNHSNVYQSACKKKNVLDSPMYLKASLNILN